MNSRKNGTKRRFLRYDSKQVISAYGIPVVVETVVEDLPAAQPAARDHTYPVFLKACCAEITHKTEKGLIALFRVGFENDAIQEIDGNPLVITDGNLAAVDALVKFR